MCRANYPQFQKLKVFWVGHRPDHIPFNFKGKEKPVFKKQIINKVIYAQKFQTKTCTEGNTVLY